MRLADVIAGGAGLHRLGAAATPAAMALAVGFAWLVHWVGGFPLLAIGTAIGAAKVIWAAPRATVPLIADRLVGMWLALWPLSGGLWFAGAAPHIFPWPGWIGAMLIFALARRAPPIRRLGLRHPLADDLTAGAVAASLVLIAAAISHGWLR